jgi:AcrR family transcriptional regulator
MTTKAAENARRAPIQARARFTRDAILDATARILEQEPTVPSTNRIAKLAGVSVGTLYQYFDSREAIVRDLCRRHSEEMTALVLAHGGPMLTAPPREAVPAFVEAITLAHAATPRLHLALVRELLADGGELLAEVQDPAHALVLAWLEHHRDAIRPRDLEAAAFILTNAVEAAVHAQLLDRPERLLDAGWRAELVDMLLRYLLP